SRGLGDVYKRQAFERCAPFASGATPLPGGRLKWRLDPGSPETTRDWLAGDGRHPDPGNVPETLRAGLTFAIPLRGNFEADILVDCADDGKQPVEIELALVGERAGVEGRAASASLMVSNREGGPWGWRISDETAPVGTGARFRTGGTRKISARRVGRRLEWALDGEVQEVRVLPVAFPLGCRVRFRMAAGPEGAFRRLEMTGRPAEAEMRDATARFAREAGRKLQEALALPERERPGALDDLARRYRGCADLAARAAAACALQLLRDGRDRAALAAVARAVGLHRQPAEVLARLREGLAALRLRETGNPERAPGE
ncbi:MAG: hypothetical protein N3A38_16590, partial [Planctomycetota bacterium]|nr:hypothetical protein [Planctomycetota bacterium]